MVAVWIGGALLLGLAASRVGLPPLVGFLVSGFVFSAIGMERAPLLEDLAHAGVLLLLFAVGLKLRLKTLARFEVWGTAVAHLVLIGAIGAVLISAGAGLSWQLSVVLAISLGFSSTVLAAKVLEGNRELRAVHGRVAIGILIVQDIVAVALLAAISVDSPSPWALLLLLLPFTRPADCVAARFLRPRRAARAVRCAARDRQRRAVPVPRIGPRARRAAARHDARRPQARARAHERALGLEGAVSRRVLLEHRLQRPAELGGDARRGLARAVLAVPGDHLLLLVDRLGIARPHELPHGDQPRDLQRVRADRGGGRRRERFARPAVAHRRGRHGGAVVCRGRAAQRLRARAVRVARAVARAVGARQAASGRRADLARQRRDSDRRDGSRRIGRLRLSARAARKHRRHRQRPRQDRVESPRGPARRVCGCRGSGLLAACSTSTGCAPSCSRCPTSRRR